MTEKQKIALAFSVLFALGVVFIVARMVWHLARWLLAQMEGDIRITALVVAACSLSIAACAFIVAWNNFRRGNTAVVKLIDMKMVGTHSVASGGKFDHLFMVYVKNLGIPLHAAEIGLNAMTKFGTISIPFERLDVADQVVPLATLEKGMVGIFGLKQSRLQLAQKKMLQVLLDGAEDITVGVFSSSFKVTEFPIPSRHARFTKGWDKLAQKLNDKCTTTKKRWGKEYTVTRTIFHVFGDREIQLKLFVGAAVADLPPDNPPTPKAQ